MVDIMESILFSKNKFDSIEMYRMGKIRINFKKRRAFPKLVIRKIRLYLFQKYKFYWIGVECSLDTDWEYVTTENSFCFEVAKVDDQRKEVGRYFKENLDQQHRILLSFLGRMIDIDQFDESWYPGSCPSCEKRHIIDNLPGSILYRLCNDDHYTYEWAKPSERLMEYLEIDDDENIYDLIINKYDFEHEDGFYFIYQPELTLID